MASAKKVEVNVILESDNPVRFRIEPVGKSIPVGPQGELIFYNDHHPGFHVWFYLQDPNDLGYLFPPNNKKHEAIWSELGSGSCPQPPGKSDVFHAERVLEPECTTLVVLNPNPSPAQGAFGYTLRVTKDRGATYLPLDPGGLNQNGPQSRFTTTGAFVAGAAVGAVAGSVATLGVQAMMGG
jgi:hypothetical protein